MHPLHVFKYLLVSTILYYTKNQRRKRPPAVDVPRLSITKDILLMAHRHPKTDKDVLGMATKLITIKERTTKLYIFPSDAGSSENISVREKYRM